MIIGQSTLKHFKKLISVFFNLIDNGNSSTTIDALFNTFLFLHHQAGRLLAAVQAGNVAAPVPERRRSSTSAEYGDGQGDVTTTLDNSCVSVSVFL